MVSGTARTGMIPSQDTARHYAGMDCYLTAKHAAYATLRCCVLRYRGLIGTGRAMTGHGGSDLFIVDDDVSVRDALTAVFTLEGYRITRFAEGDSFLAAARQHIPACVLLDVHM